MKYLALAGLLALPAIAHAQTPRVPPGEVPLIGELAIAPSSERIEADIRTLAGFGTRHTLSETESETRGIGAARRWVKAQFDEISAECGGCLEVFYVSGVAEGLERIPDPTEVVSVVALQRGTLDPDRMIFMSGDIDSRISDVMNFTDDSPGANDNASGVAGVIEAARLLSKHQFPGTIGYLALSGEEQGLVGGEIVAAHAIEEGWNVVGVLNNDMIGNSRGIDGVVDNTSARVFSEGTRVVETPEEARERRFQGGEVDSASRNLARYVDMMADRYVPNLDVMMVYRLDRFGRGGHHRPFNDAGMPGVRIMETHEDYRRQHQDIRVEDGVEYGDVVEVVDFDYAAKLTGLNIAVLAGIAGAPPVPADVAIEGQVSPDTTLSWTMAEGPEAANLAGYRVHWRLTTEPQWRWSRWVGMADAYTLENIVIDNYLFGVSAVSTDGYETPVVFPGAAGAFD